MPSPESLPSKMRELVYDEDGLEDYRQWRVTQGAAMNPVMEVETVFDKQRAEFVRPLPSAALRECLASLGEPELIKDIQEGRYGWDAVVQARDAVLDKIDGARTAYNAAGKANPFRKLARDGATLTATLRPLLDMIPDEDGLSFLKGGLGFIFRIIEKRDANREKIFRAFEDVPMLLSRAQDARKTFPSEKRLLLEVRRFYEVLMEEIPLLIDLLLHKHRQKFPIRVFKYLPEQEAKDIDDALHRVHMASRSLDNCISSTSNKTLSATYQSATENLRQTQAVRQTVHTNNYKLGQLEEQGNDVKMQLDTMQQSVVKTSQELNEVKELIRGQFNAVADTASPKIVSQIQTYVYYVVVENEYARSVMGVPPPYTPSPLLPATSLLTTDQLLNELNVTPLGPTEDLQTVLAQSKTMEIDALGRGRWLMVEESFKKWLSPGQTDYLLVDGHCNGLSIRRCSPLSVFCASLTVAMAQTSATVSLAYFCGEHFSDDNYLAGPAGVMRSLITQLLQYPDLPEPRLDFIDPDFFKRISAFNVPALCTLFHLLLRQIERGTTVYCMIDNISELEGTFNEWAEEVQLMVEGLIDIAEDPRVHGTFKLLMTCEIRSTEVVNYISADKHVALRAGNVHSRPMMLTAFSDDVLDTMGPEGRGYDDYDGEGPANPDSGPDRPKSAAE